MTLFIYSMGVEKKNGSPQKEEQNKNRKIQT